MIADNYTRNILNQVRQLWAILLLCVLLASCAGTGGARKHRAIKTKHVVVVVIDGPRYSETWGSAPGLIPYMAEQLRPKGTFFADFRNNGYTYTNAGHTAITTGVNQMIDNYGEELPANPSLFQYWLAKTGQPSSKAWVISSKDKLHILGNTTFIGWQGQHLPSLNCGVSGPGSGYRADSLTLVAALQTLSQDKPSLMLINFMEPDGYAHAGNEAFYLRGIARSDRYVRQLWEYLRKDKHYRKKTALLITNDHGRHLDGINGGWMEHGDSCEGCQRISLLALGPDFRRGATVPTAYTLVDIPATISLMLGVQMEQGQGTVMQEMFRRKAAKRLGLR